MLKKNKESCLHSIFLVVVIAAAIGATSARSPYARERTYARRREQWLQKGDPKAQTLGIYSQFQLASGTSPESLGSDVFPQNDW